MDDISLCDKICNVADRAILMCNALGIKVTESLAVFMLRMLTVSSDWGEKLEQDASLTICKELAEVCMELLIEKSNPVISNYRLQVYFDLNYRDMSHFVKERNMAHKSKLNTMVHKLSTKVCSSLGEIQALYKEIVEYVYLHEKSHQKYDKRKFKDTERAVATLFPVTYMNNFLEFSIKEKKYYLKQLGLISSGLCFFNWYEGRGQNAAKDMIKMVSENVPKLVEDIVIEKNRTEDSIRLLEEIMSYHYLEENSKENIVGEDIMKHLKLYLAFLHQYAYFLNIMTVESGAMLLRTQRLILSFKQSADDLRAAISSSSVLPLEIFEQYKDIGQKWKDIVTEYVLLRHYFGMLRKIKDFEMDARGSYDVGSIKSLRNSIHKRRYTKAKEEEKEDDDDDESEIRKMIRLRAEIRIILEDLCNDAQNLKLLDSSSVSNFENITLEYEGFCPWALLKGRGLLIKGNRALGLLHYEGKCYTFSSIRSFKSFCFNAKDHLSSIKEVVKENPHLIVTLKLQHDFNINMCNDSIFRKGEQVEPKFIISTGAQTILHPIEKHVDSSYRWNQWELRKQAVKYLDIKTKKTHSTQTDLSHFRRENFSQVYLPKDNFSQTKKDSCTSMTKAQELFTDVRKTILQLQW